MRGNQFVLAVQTMALLALTPEEAHTSYEIATQLGKHPAFLRRLTGKLVSADLLLAHQGPGGGNVLALPANAITLADVYSAVVRITLCKDETT